MLTDSDLVKKVSLASAEDSSRYSARWRAGRCESSDVEGYKCQQVRNQNPL